jgi:uncharacterized membrane protein YjfL (UPF0719 family)
MNEFHPTYLINAAAFATLGIVIFCFAFAVITKLMPSNLWNEIVENQNTAVAILLGAISIGICLIIAAAMH